ncbi:Hypothetical predicted protein, partial [Lynx pardinus]
MGAVGGGDRSDLRHPVPVWGGGGFLGFCSPQPSAEHRRQPTSTLTPSPAGPFSSLLQSQIFLVFCVFMLHFSGLFHAADLSKPIDKRIYKGTQPTCHDFNHLTATAESVSLLVGFSAGQVQLIDPIKKETSKLFNEERLIDKSRVTCVKWVPGSESLFLVAHASGNMYLYNVEHTCGTTAPHYQLLKQGESFAVHTCKSKSTRNPLLKWTVGEGALNEFAFSPDGKFLACVSQDGFLRVFNFDSVELHGTMKSYFGGLLCVCWSPDGKYIVTGGEDDL